MSGALIGAASVASGVVIGGWSLAGVRLPQRRQKVSTAGMVARVGLPVDMRQAVLDQAMGDRVVKPGMAALARRGRKLTPTGVVQSLERRINAAGANQKWPIEKVLAGKFVLSLAGLVLGGLMIVSHPSSVNFVLLIVFVTLGYFAPDLILYNDAVKRAEEIQRELADTLDQITIMVEAGLGFEAAVDRVARAADTPLKQELSRMLREVRLGASRHQAMENLVERANVPDLKKFVHAVIQSDAYGIPIANVLRTQSADLRDKRKQRAEEAAQKVPVKILLPLVLCILPALFIVILGPAGIRIMHTFAGQAH